MIFGWLGAETIMIKNGLYALAAIPRQGSGDEVSGVLILNDGTMLGATLSSITRGPTNAALETGKAK
ncbi:hypothetical protein V1283_002670 [Bradyrhizobium sp. AZCC 2262]